MAMDYELAYMKLKAKVSDMLQAQQDYFKSNRDQALLKKSKAIEKEVREMINPKPTSQLFLSEEFLGR